MKLFTKYSAPLALALSLVGFSACQDDFSGREPAFEEPHATMEPTLTITELKNMYWESETNFADTIGLVYNDVDDITGQVVYQPRDSKGHRKQVLDENGQPKEFIIKGRVCTNDYDGNIFKKMVIQSEDGDALCFSIDAYSLYLNYRYGQEIVIKLNGLCFGAYAGQHVVGIAQWYEQNQVWETGRMPLDYFKNIISANGETKPRVELNGYPEPSEVRILDLNLADLATYQGDLKKYENRIVRFNNVYFPDADGKATLGRYKESSTTHQVKDNAGGSINLDTSGYATFWYKPLPVGEISITGMLFYSSSKGFQLQLNDYAGLDTDPEAPKGLTPESAYTVDEVIEIEAAGNNGNGWLTGYIVGAVAAEVENVISKDEDIEWGPFTDGATLAATVVIAPNPDVRSVASCIIVPLPAGSTMRDLVNLRDNPSNFGKQLWVNGNFSKYMEAWGVSTTGAVGTFQLEGVEVPGGEPSAGAGTEDSPYNCAQIRAMDPLSTTDAVASGVWATGYIVGYYANYAANFTADGAAAANILLSDTPDASDVAQCICIQLVSGSDVRKNLNLLDNPGNIGKLVSVCGDVMKYNSMPGIKNTSAYKMDGQSSDPTPDPGPTGTPAGSGTQTDPYNVAKALEICAAGTYTSDKVYIKGIVSSVTSSSFDASYGSLIYFISDNGTATSQLEIYRGYGLNGDKWASADALKPGDNVIVYGALTNYNGTYEVTTGSQLYELNGQTASGGTTGGGTTGGDVDHGTPAGEGTQASPYNLAKAFEIYAAGGTTTAVWIEAYIVGSIPGMNVSSAVFGTADASGTNILVAASVTETNVANCMPVALKAGGAARTDLNLADHPEMLGKRVLLNGTITKYFGTAGIKEVNEYVLPEANAPKHRAGRMAR